MRIMAFANYNQVGEMDGLFSAVRELMYNGSLSDAEYFKPTINKISYLPYYILRGDEMPRTCSECKCELYI